MGQTCNCTFSLNVYSRAHRLTGTVNACRSTFPRRVAGLTGRQTPHPHPYSDTGPSPATMALTEFHPKGTHFSYLFTKATKQEEAFSLLPPRALCKSSVCSFIWHIDFSNS